MNKPCELTATEMSRLLKAGDLTPQMIAVSCLDRITDRDEKVRAWAHLKRDQVLATIESLPEGSLFGIPVGVKDIIETNDMPTEYGSKIYSGFQPNADANCVSTVKAAGGIIMGKTVTTEFAWRRANNTQNPHSPLHTPGGSSSGSAAAVADFQVPLSFGTQTAGSVIRPAAYCGVIGFKPPFGRYPTEGVKPLSPSLDTVGLFARSVSDIALFDTALTSVSHELNADPPKLAIFIPFPDQLEKVGTRVIEDATRRLSAAGANVVDTQVFPAIDKIVDAHETIMIGEIGRALIYELDNFPDGLNDYYKNNISRGASISEDEIENAQITVATARNTVASIFENTDLIITPPAAGPAPKGLEFTGDPLFNKIWTALGWPCLTMPAPTHFDPLPLGIQFVSPENDVSAFLAKLAWVEKVLNH